MSLKKSFRSFIERFCPKSNRASIKVFRERDRRAANFKEYAKHLDTDEKLNQFIDRLVEERIKEQKQERKNNPPPELSPIQREELVQQVKYLRKQAEKDMSKVIINSGLGFGAAWDAILNGRPAKGFYALDREGWNGADQYVRVIFASAPHPSVAPEANPINPYFNVVDSAQADGTLSSFAVIRTTQNKVFPWTPSQGDLFGTDYRVILISE